MATRVKRHPDQSETLHDFRGSPHHRHSGIALHTPTDVHHGRSDTVRAARQTVLDAAYTAHPDRFRQPPCAPRIPEAAWINQPQEQPLTPTAI